MSKLPAISLYDLAERCQTRGCGLKACGPNVRVRGVRFDSRKVEPGNLFVCKGVHFDPAYLTLAKEAGAVAYLCEAEAFDTLSAIEPDLPALVAVDAAALRVAMAIVSRNLYHWPEQEISVVGITGTKGKSTVAYMIRSILIAEGRTPGIMGSIDTDDGVECFESINTTPEAPDLWRHLRNAADSDRDAMVMEVSSHGLKYDRTLGLRFDIAAFLNIDRDHVSGVEHADFEDYFTSKLKIFAQSDVAVVNLNSMNAERVLDAAKGASRLVTFGVDRPEADYCGVNVHRGKIGIELDVLAEGEIHHMVLGMTGTFNADNALVAAAIARLMDVDWESIRKGLLSARVPGRMELFQSIDGQITALVDYAHNRLSFQALFASVKKEYAGRKVISVFGAPGNKAQERREQLPQIAGPNSDLMIFTEEDPAHERVEDICADLASNTPEGCAFEIVPDREEAIRRAFDVAEEWGQPAVVLLLAKGRETRQHRGDEFPLVKSDTELALEILGHEL